MKENKIVEETNKDRCYTVYMHTSPSGKRYIGITSTSVERRWLNGRGYSTQMFYRAVLKYGWDNIIHEILYTNLTKEEAERMEIELIVYYKSNQPDFGYNIANGGNCAESIAEETRQKLSEAHKGKIPSEETRKKLSKATSGVNNPFYGKKHTDETKQKLREIHLGLESKLKGVPQTDETKKKESESAKRRFANPKNHPMFGVHHTDETKQKMSKSHKGLKQSEEHSKHNGESHKKPIIQYTKQFEFIQMWDSATDAARAIGGHSTCIAACCRKRISSAYGFIWRYAVDVEDLTNSTLSQVV